jgi:uncharacterized protein YjfI (DUF2170 family)
MTWSNKSLKELAESQPSWVVEAEGECLTISNDEGIDAFVYVGSQQVIVEAALFPASDVKDVNALNELILRSHHLLPLTAICINKIAEQDYYIAFGALSVDSKDSVIIEEIETLFANTGEFLDLYSQYLAQETIA